MSKILTLILSLLLAAITQSQTRLNEVFLANNGSNQQWIELYSYSNSLDGLNILVKYKNPTDSGFYILGLTGSPISNYFVTQFDGDNVWSNLSYLKKVRWDGTLLSIDAIEANNILNPSGENHLFLINGNGIKDVLVTGISGTATPYLKAQYDVNAWSPFTYSDATVGSIQVNFTFVQLTNLNTPHQSAGAGSSFAFIYTAGGCTDEYPWKKVQMETNGYLNTGSVEPHFDYWNVDYKLANSYNRAPGDFYIVTNNRIPDASPSFDYAPNGSPTQLYFKYTLTNTSPMSVTVSNPHFYMYYDKGGVEDRPNGVLDFTDPQISSNVTKTDEGNNTIYVTLAITDDMFYFNPAGDRKLRPFFFVLESANSCFKTQYILISEKTFALPVLWGSFQIKKQERSVVLNWTTQMEVNNQGFQVERSAFKNKWESLGYVSARSKNGNSSLPISYSFVDEESLDAGIYLYRIRQIDFDGKYSYSAVKSIQLNEMSPVIDIFPNPTTGVVKLNVGLSKMKVQVYDPSGRMVKAVYDAQSKIELNLSTKGNYTLMFTLPSGEMYTRRLIVN